ncbi:MAG: alpha/beta hydrolase-fold protein [Ekhidna sp.]|uniref:alpha/beta hydrolase-fold protein n=1 Tax=Ekhidna sp. TaxID=2608089 RepID=UPI0032EE629E
MINSVQFKCLCVTSLLLIATILPFDAALAQGQNEPQNTFPNWENTNIQVIPIQDSKTGRNYELYVELPEDYSENNDKTYPVLYYTDAAWHLEVLSAGQEYILEDVILVGISWQKDIDPALVEEHGEHVSRFRDYTIRPSSKPEIQAKYQLGQASNHLEFILKDVIPYVENNYQTDPQNRSYFGYSASGLFGAYILSERPKTFKNYLIGSPSLRGNISYLSELIADKDLNANVFISNGTEEIELNELVREFVALLENQNSETLHITHEEILGDHQTAFPRMAVRSVGWLAELNKPEFPVLTGPLMGQEPPGLIAEPFAPGIISKDAWELEGVFAPGMKEFYFTLDRGIYSGPNETGFRPTVIGFRQENNVWKKFTEFLRTGEVTFSPDGSRMHMAKGYRDRVGDGWSERKSLGSMFDRKEWGIMRLSASENGTYVFDDFKSGDVIRISTLKDGKHQEPVKMSSVVNSGKMTAHPFIAPDESYLIWDSEREGGYGESDLYISFRQEGGTWGPAINMGDQVNSANDDFYASVTPDGKYILFNRKMDDTGDNIDIYWVDARIIDQLRTKQ